MSASPNLIVLANFNGYNGNGPGNLLTDANGNLYGTTYSSIGTNSDIVFELQNTGSGYSAPIMIASYPITDEIYPTQMIMDSAGDLYGIFDSWAAPTSYSTVVELKKTASGYSVPIGLAGFLDNSSYGGPVGAVAVDSAGDVFGTTKYGGVNNNGTLFEIVPSSSSATGYGNPVTLVDFTGANGTLPEGNLIVDSSGNLFGTTGQGGANGYGTVFELVKSASGYSSAPVTLTSFDSTNDFPDSLIMDSAGDLFGTTEYGGPDTVGTVFELVKSASGYSAPVTLAIFSRSSDGAYPGSLVMDKAGDLFGVTNLGGANDLGTVFEMVKSASGYSAPVTIYTFDSLNGAEPTSLLINSAGDLIGTTSQGGMNDDGIVFKLTFGPIAPTLTVTNAALQSNQTTVSLSGTIDAAGAGLPISIYDGTTLLGTTAASTAGAWSTSVTVSAQGVHTLTAQATNAGGTGISNSVVDLVSASTSLSGGGQLVLFSGLGDAVTLSATANNWDYVTGAGGTINLNGAQTSVAGGGDTIDYLGSSGNAASLYNTAGNWDYINGSSGTVYLTNAQTSVAGGGDTVNFLGSSGDAASLYNTAGNWDYINGSGGTVYLTNAQTSVAGGGDTVNFLGSSGNAASLYNTAGNWDYINGSGGTVYLTNAQTSVAGGGDTVNFLGSSGNAASLYNTAGNWDYINGSGGTVYLTNAQTSVAGGGDTVNFLGSSGNAASLYNTAGNWDYINGSGGTVYLTNAQTSVAGGGDIIDFLGSSGNAASLYNTAGTADTINGSNGSIYLTGAQASVTGNSNTLNFLGTGNTASVSGSTDAFVFQAAFGQDAINGFASTDTMQLAASDFANWSALLGHMTQSGSNTLITLDASDKITLTNVAMSSLQSSQFSFK